MTDIATRAPLRTRWASGWSVLLWGLAGVLALCQAMVWYEPETPRLAVLEQFALQLGIVALLAAVLALVLRRRARFVLLAALTATLSWPVFSPRGEAAIVAEPARLKVVSANLWHSAAGHDRTIEALLASDADIIGLIEATPGWRPALAPLFAKYPYRIDCFDLDPECQTMLLSKLPIEQAGGRSRVEGDADRRGRRRPVERPADHRAGDALVPTAVCAATRARGAPTMPNVPPTWPKGCR